MMAQLTIYKSEAAQAVHGGCGTTHSGAKLRLARLNLAGQAWQR